MLGILIGEAKSGTVRTSVFASLDDYSTSEVIEEFWGPSYQRFREGVCEINQHAAS
jgi:hypothetical protein